MIFNEQENGTKKEINYNDHILVKKKNVNF